MYVLITLFNYVGTSLLNYARKNSYVGILTSTGKKWELIKTYEDKNENLNK